MLRAMRVATAFAWAMAAASCTTVVRAAGPAGYALRFHGNGSGDIDRVKVSLDAPARPVDVAGDFTLEFWMKALAVENPAGPCQTGPDRWIYGNIVVDRDVYGDGDHGDYGISLLGGRVAFGVGVGAAGQTICSAAVVTDGAWHHVAVTRRAADGQLRVFVDGQPSGTGSGPTGNLSYRDGRPSSWPNSDPFLVLGAEKHDAGTAYPSYSGWLDELRVSNVVRYTGAFARPTQPFASDAQTMALYHFDAGSGDTVHDSSAAVGGPSHGLRRFGGAPAGPVWGISDAPLPVELRRFSAE